MVGDRDISSRPGWSNSGRYELKPVTARPDHMDPAGGRGAGKVCVIPVADPVVRIGEIGRFQAVAQETGHSRSGTVNVIVRSPS
jgi:hypothetical protein